VREAEALTIPLPHLDRRVQLWHLASVCCVAAAAAWADDRLTESERKDLVQQYLRKAFEFLKDKSGRQWN
jgi:hypothetical protein